MNKAEKRVLVLVIFLFSIGFLVRHSPWNLPEVGSVPIEFREYQEEQISLETIGQANPNLFLTQ